MKKRFNAEIKRHTENYKVSDEKGKWNSKVKNCYCVSHGFNTVNFKITLSNKSIHIVEITVPKLYPFKPPEVKLNGKNYNTLFLCRNFFPETTVIDENYQNFYINKLTNNGECPCCSSILCNDNWYPLLGFSNILNEIIELLERRLRIREIRYAQQVMRQNIGFTIPTIFEML